MNQLNSDQQILNNSTTPSNSLFDGHMQKYPISPMMNSSFNNRDDTMRNFDLWKMEMDRKVNKKLGSLTRLLSLISIPIGCYV